VNLTSFTAYLVALRCFESTLRFFALCFKRFLYFKHFFILYFKKCFTIFYILLKTTLCFVFSRFLFLHFNAFYVLMDTSPKAQYDNAK